MTAQLDLPGVPAAPDAPAWSGNHIRVSWVGERLAPFSVSTPTEATAYWFRNVRTHPFFDPDKEHLAVCLVNAKTKCFAWNLVSIGTLNETVAHPREILRPAIAAAAWGFLLMHNHPSGNSDPSDADRRLTQSIVEAAKIMAISLLDHVVVGRSEGDRYFSFRESGYL